VATDEQLDPLPAEDSQTDSGQDDDEASVDQSHDELSLVEDDGAGDGLDVEGRADVGDAEPEDESSRTSESWARSGFTERSEEGDAGALPRREGAELGGLPRRSADDGARLMASEFGGNAESHANSNSFFRHYSDNGIPVQREPQSEQTAATTE
jgi:hypothetical protein